MILDISCHANPLSPILSACRASAGAAESLALARRAQVDPGQEHGQLRRLKFDAILGDRPRHLEAPRLETLEDGITMPSLLWRYTNGPRPDRDRSRVARL
jgi:hypothetical protein